MVQRWRKFNVDAEPDADCALLFAPRRLNCGIGSSKIAQTADAANASKREEAIMQAAIRLAALVLLCAMPL